MSRGAGVTLSPAIAGTTAPILTMRCIPAATGYRFGDVRYTGAGVGVSRGVFTVPDGEG